MSAKPAPTSKDQADEAADGQADGGAQQVLEPGWVPPAAELSLDVFGPAEARADDQPGDASDTLCGRAPAASSQRQPAPSENLAPGAGARGPPGIVREAFSVTPQPTAGDETVPTMPLQLTLGTAVPEPLPGDDAARDRAAAVSSADLSVSASHGALGQARGPAAAVPETGADVVAGGGRPAVSTTSAGLGGSASGGSIGGAASASAPADAAVAGDLALSGLAAGQPGAGLQAADLPEGLPAPAVEPAAPAPASAEADARALPAQSRAEGSRRALPAPAHGGLCAGPLGEPSAGPFGGPVAGLDGVGRVGPAGSAVGADLGRRGDGATGQDTGAQLPPAPADLAEALSLPAAVPAAAAPPEASSLAPPSAQPLPSARPAEVPARLASAAARLGASVEGGAQNVSLHLNPPELGRLHLQMQVQGQSVFVRCRAETHEAASFLRGQIDGLRAQLDDRGLSLGGFEMHDPRGDTSPGDRRPAPSDRLPAAVAPPVSQAAARAFLPPAPARSLGASIYVVA